MPPSGTLYYRTCSTLPVEIRDISNLRARCIVNDGILQLTVNNLGTGSLESTIKPLPTMNQNDIFSKVVSSAARTLTRCRAWERRYPSPFQISHPNHPVDSTTASRRSGIPYYQILPRYRQCHEPHRYVAIS
jgi:hypothetical protein